MRYATFMAHCAGSSASAAFAQAPAAPAAAADSRNGPTEVVQSAAQGMLAELDKDRAAYRKDPAKVEQLVDKYLLPHFDTRVRRAAGARPALAHRDARAAQALRRCVLPVAAQQLRRGDGRFHRRPPQGVPDQAGEPMPTRATVRTEIKRSNGTASR